MWRSGGCAHRCVVDPARAKRTAGCIWAGSAHEWSHPPRPSCVHRRTARVSSTAAEPACVSRGTPLSSDDVAYSGSGNANARLGRRRVRRPRRPAITAAPGRGASRESVAERWRALIEGCHCSPRFASGRPRCHVRGTRARELLEAGSLHGARPSGSRYALARYSITREAIVHDTSGAKAVTAPQRDTERELRQRSPGRP